MFSRNVRSCIHQDSLTWIPKRELNKDSSGRYAEAHEKSTRGFSSTQITTYKQLMNSEWENYSSPRKRMPSRYLMSIYMKKEAMSLKNSVDGRKRREKWWNNTIISHIKETIKIQNMYFPYLYLLFVSIVQIPTRKNF